MAKVLKEDLNNEYSRTITKVEDFMRDNEVSLEFDGGYWFVTIKGKRFRGNFTNFPRIFDDEKLTILE